MTLHRRYLIQAILVFALASCRSSVPGISTTGTVVPASPISTEDARISTGLSGPYLGQPDPGSYPAIFAGGIISGDLHTSPVFTPDGSEAYWALQNDTIWISKVTEGFWTQPESISFSSSIRDYRDPFLSPAGERLFFISKGKIPNSKLPVKENIWYVDRVGAGWGEPQPVSEKVNAYNLHWQISVNQSGDLYFGSQLPSCGDIYVSRISDGVYQEPQKLGAAINSETLCEQTPFIAPDGSYLIFSRMDMNDSSGMIYLNISYADGEGEWTEPAMVPGTSYGLCPIISPDGKYLFYLSSPQSVSWMSADFIEELRP
ncbi:MAG: hypothetical protein WCF08_10600 [Anaerolineaceae bacterium]